MEIIYYGINKAFIKKGCFLAITAVLDLDNKKAVPISLKVVKAKALISIKYVYALLLYPEK